ncbi:MAG: hypothetical protein CM15mL5_2100 [uncultured marine virus]|nr:MAG: hypothetical protein CM15mL5_2100 [uncultured marine virus]
MTHMDNQESQSRTNLKTATFNVMGLIALFENDHINECIRSDLVSVRDNIEKQIEALSIIEDSKSAYMASTPITTQETIMANTYRIEEEVTTGWTLISDQTENLSKEKAKEVYQNLVDREGYNPNRLRIVVDGQV